jgi:hypothetical protein
MPVPDDAAFAGIRANNLRLDESGSESTNVIRCRVAGISEGPFRVQVFLVPEGSPPHDERSILQWDIPKDGGRACAICRSRSECTLIPIKYSLCDVCD